ncbi:ATP-grasp domain-containing protein [candidate division KSB1 bacterium]|nr:ATP-grasp domain-containing protein [candidate division KSB1 bacterium]
MNEVNVLVTAVGGGVGQSIMKALKMCGLGCRIITMDCNPLSAGLYRADSGYITPSVHSQNYIEKIIQICKEQNIHALLIGCDPELPVLAQHKEIIEQETNARVIVSSPKVIKIGNDKWETFLFLKRNGFNAPHTFLPHQEKEIKEFLAQKGFPVIIKPRSGSASRGVNIAYNYDELQVFVKRNNNTIIQEYVGTEDQEYTSGLFMTRDNKIAGVITIKRELYCGTTYRAIIDHFPDIEEKVRQIGNRLKPYGPCNFQMRISDGQPVVIEINPRFSGTTVMRAKFGFNETEAAIRHFVFGEDVGEMTFNTGIALRYWNEVYISVNDFKQLQSKGSISHPKSETTFI